MRTTLELIGEEGIGAVTNRRVATAAGDLARLAHLPLREPGGPAPREPPALRRRGGRPARRDRRRDPQPRPRRRAGRPRDRARRPRVRRSASSGSPRSSCTCAPPATPPCRRPRGAASRPTRSSPTAGLEMLEVPDAGAARARGRRPAVRAGAAPARDRRRRRQRHGRGAADDRPRRPAPAMILAIDQGTTGTTCLVFDREGRVAGRGLLRVRAALPAARLGRARRRRDLGGDAAGRRRGDRRRRDRGRRARRDRDRQPARDRRRLGPGDRRAAAPGARLAGPPHGRALRGAARGRARGARPRAHRARPRPLLLRDQDRVAAAQRRGRRAGGLRHDRLLARLQAHRPPRDRPHQRLADDALRHPPAAPGTRSSASCSASTRRACRSRCPRPRSSGRPPSSAARSRSRGSPATSRRRSSVRPASSPGRAKNTYGTGSFVLLNTGAGAAEPGRRPARRRSPAATGGGARLRARGLDLRHRRRRAVAARRPRGDRGGGRDRGAGGLAWRATTASTSSRP